MDYVVNSVAFDESWQRLVRQVSTTSAELFLYGIYVHFFISAIRNLSRRRTAGKVILITASWAMLLLGTAQIVVQVAASTVSICFTQGLVRERTNITGGPAVAINSLINATIIIFAINNLVTDTLFLYRCYVIWDFRKKVIILPGMFLLSTFVFGVFASYTVEDNLITIAYTMATATNILLTTLTAGRIWWKRRQTSHTGLDDTFRKWYSTAVAIILESGAAYFVCGILLVSTIAIEPRGNSMIYGIVLGITRQSVNIVPALSIVRGTAREDQQISDVEKGREDPITRPKRTTLIVGRQLEPSVLYIKPMEAETYTEGK